MYSEDVWDLRKQKIVYNLGMLKDFVIVYGKQLLLMPEEVELRKKYLEVVKKWFIYNKNESEVLNYILQNYGDVEDDEVVDEVLEILDDLFANTFEYYDDVLEGYEDMIVFKQPYRAKFLEPRFEVLNEEKKISLIKKMSNNK